MALEELREMCAKIVEDMEPVFSTINGDRILNFQRFKYLLLEKIKAIPLPAEPECYGNTINTYELGTWFEAHTINEMSAFYMSRLPAIRTAARECGYAIGLHGSTKRDFDLMAMQWTEDCASPNELAHAIARAACDITRDCDYDWENKPLGRIATTIPICWTNHSENFDKNLLGFGHLDLSIMSIPVEQSRKDFATSDEEGGFKDLISQFRKAAWERDMDEMLRIQKFIFDLVENELPEQEPANPTVNNSLTVAALEKQVAELENKLLQETCSYVKALNYSAETAKKYDEALKLVVKLQLRIDGIFHNGLKWHSPGMGEVHSHDHKYEIQCMVEIPETPEGQDQIACTDLADKVCDALNEIDVMKKQVAELETALRHFVSYANDVGDDSHEFDRARSLLDKIDLARERAK